MNANHLRWICSVTLLFVWLTSSASGQVDVEHRRLLTLQSGHAIGGPSEEALDGYGFFWFNEDHFPWDRTALRLNYAVVYLDTELSYFLPVPTVTAVGVRLGGGVFSDDLHPYVRGEHLATESFYGDSGLVSVFINHEITKIGGQLPVNVRATYEARRTSYRENGNTSQFDLPPDFYTQTIAGEFRLGGLEREIASRRGLVAYVKADANYRSDFNSFGPVTAPFPTYSQYQRVLAQLGAKIPVKRTTVFFLLTGGTGHDLDELSAWRLGGNLVNADPTIYSLHGYYTKEFFVKDFGLVNFEISQQIVESHNVTLHFYADCAAARSVPPDQSDTRILPGLGAGIGFRTFWATDVLLNYGYGFSAVRNGDRGGHEVALALEKSF